MPYCSLAEYYVYQRGESQIQTSISKAAKAIQNAAKPQLIKRKETEIIAKTNKIADKLKKTEINERKCKKAKAQSMTNHIAVVESTKARHEDMKLSLEEFAEKKRQRLISKQQEAYNVDKRGKQKIISE